MIQADATERLGHALDRARLGFWDWDLVSGRCVYSDTWKRMLGYDPSELPDEDDLWIKFMHPDDRDQVIAVGDRHIAGATGEIESEFRMRHRDGRWIWVLDRGGITEWDEAGRPTRMIGVQTDISGQKVVEAEIAYLNGLYQLALGASGISIWEYEVVSGSVQWDAQLSECLGLEPGPGIYDRTVLHRILHPQDAGRVERRLARALKTGEVVKIRSRVLRRDGAVRHIEALARLASDPLLGSRLIGTARDITEEALAAEALEFEKERLRVTLQSIRDAVVSADAVGRIVYANEAAANLFGRGQAELAGLHVGDLALSAVREPVEAGAPLIEELTLGGVSRVLRCTRSPIPAAFGMIAGTVHTFQDITQDHRRQSELTHAARHDALTGALNRAAFDEALRSAIANAGCNPFAILYVDLDYFKALNDFAGHAAGDAALVAVTRGLAAALPRATIGRLGGDEFAVLVPIENDGEAANAAEAALEAIGRADIPVAVGHPQLAASIGIEIVRSEVDTPTEALARADDACYAAKAGGRNGMSIYRQGCAGKSQTAIRLASEIGEAMQEGRLELFGQEIRLLREPWRPGRRCEVLARMKGRDGRAISPAAFIPAAERFGMARSLDRWIIETALSTYGRQMAGQDGLCLSFNLSAQTICDLGLWEFVCDLIDHQRIHPGNLVFEITETAAMTNLAAVETFIHQARARGCGIALDDFGSGFSSLGYLKRFEVDIVKIDGLFVEKVATNRFDQAIISSIAGIARDIGFKLVAERVEDQEALAVLERIGIDYAQGYLLHRPEPLGRLFARDAAASNSSPPAPAGLAHGWADPIAGLKGLDGPVSCPASQGTSR